jgi:hypothetical protein
VSLVTAGVGGWVGGFSGLVLALTVSSSAACLFFLWRVCSLTETRNLDCVREMIGIPLLAVAVSAIAGLGVFRATDSMIDFSGRLGDLSQLVITGGAFMLTYLGGLIRSGYLAPRDLWTTYRQSAQAEVCPDLPPAP